MELGQEIGWESKQLVTQKTKGLDLGFGSSPSSILQTRTCHDCQFGIARIHTGNCLVPDYTPAHSLEPTFETYYNSIPLREMNQALPVIRFRSDTAWLCSRVAGALAYVFF
jgi:hypothetical protein